MSKRRVALAILIAAMLALGAVLAYASGRVSGRVSRGAPPLERCAGGLLVLGLVLLGVAFPFSE